MNIDPNTYGYVYEADLLCPACTLELLIEQGRLSPAARDMGLEAALEQLIEAEAIDNLERYDSDQFPVAQSRYDLDPEDICGGCHGSLLG